MRKNSIAFTATIPVEPKALADIDKFITRLVAKMEERLHAKEDTYTLAYYLIRTHRTLYTRALWEFEHGGPAEYEQDLTFEGAEALSYELKTYPARPRGGVLVAILSELDRGIKERKQHVRDNKRTTQRRNRPTVREARGLRPASTQDAA